MDIYVIYVSNVEAEDSFRHLCWHCIKNTQRFPLVIIVSVYVGLPNEWINSQYPVPLLSSLCNISHKQYYLGSCQLK